MTKKRTKKKKNGKKKHFTKKQISSNKKVLKRKHSKKSNKIAGKEIEKIAKVQIKKSFKDRQKKAIKTSYLVFILVFSVLTVAVINLRHFFPLIKHPIKKQIPITLERIDDEAAFLRTQTGLMENSLKYTTKNEEICQNDNWLNNKNQHSVVIDKKYLVILKRGKLFVTNLATNKYISKTEISPIPLKEKEAIKYNNIYAINNTIAVTGYRQAQKALEISLFQLSANGILVRKDTYDLPSNKCSQDAKVINNKFISYTSRNLKTITYSAMSETDIWDEKQKAFNANHINNSFLFYNDSKLKTPYLHTITTCQIKDFALKACQQQHFIDDKINNLTITSNGLYAWVSHQNTDSQIKRTLPTSLIYQINLQGQTIPKIIQVDGAPIKNNAIELSDSSLKAIIYQDNASSPTWLTNFSNNAIASLSINLKDFRNKGLILDNPDNYQVLPSDISYSPKNKFIAQNDTLLKINADTSKIKIIRDNKLSTIDIPGKMFANYNIPEQNKLLLIYTKENNLYANYLNYSNNFNFGQEIVIANKIDEVNTTILKDEINNFNLADNQFISLPIINQLKNNGQLYLLAINSDSLAKAYTLNINKNFQRLNDGCQNSCQEDWTKVLSFFPEENLNKIYSLTGSYLKLFRLLNQNKLQLLRSINYTLKPAPPKPRRPKARIPGGAIVVNGRYVCKKKHDYVGNSKKNNKGYLHMDMECCLDPDEYPNPWCTYRPGELKVTKLRTANYHGRVKKKKHH